MAYITADTANRVFELAHKDFYINEILRKYLPKKSIRDEFQNEVWLYLLEHPDKTVEAWNNKYFKYLFASIVKNQICSNDSNWHNNFRKPQQMLSDAEIPEEESEEINPFQEEEEHSLKQIKRMKLKIVDEALAHFTRLDPKFKVCADMFNDHYKNHMTIREIGKKYFNTPTITVFRYIKEARLLVIHYKNKYHPGVNKF